jgi:hypothetical protein
MHNSRTRNNNNTDTHTVVNATEEDLHTTEQQLDYVARQNAARRCQGVDYDAEQEYLKCAITRARSEGLARIQSRLYVPENPHISLHSVNAEFEASVTHNCVLSRCGEKPNALWHMTRGSRYVRPSNGLQYEASGAVYTCYATGKRHVCTEVTCEYIEQLENGEAERCKLTRRLFGPSLVATYVPMNAPRFEDGTQGRGFAVPVLADATRLTANSQLYELHRTDVDNTRAVRTMVARRIEKACITNERQQNAARDAAQQSLLALTDGSEQRGNGATTTALVTAEAARKIATARNAAHGLVPRLVMTTTTTNSTAAAASSSSSALTASGDTTALSVNAEMTSIMLPADAKGVRRVLYKPTIADRNPQTTAIDSPQHLNNMRAYFVDIASAIFKHVWEERSVAAHVRLLREKHTAAERALTELLAGDADVTPLQLIATFTRITRHDFADAARALVNGDRFASPDGTLLDRAALVQLLTTRMLHIWCRVQATPKCIADMGWQRYRREIVALVEVAVRGLSSAVCLKGTGSEARVAQLCAESPYCGHVKHTVVFVTPHATLQDLIKDAHISRLASSEGRQGKLSAANAIRLCYASLFENTTHNNRANAAASRTLADIERDFCIGKAVK